MHQGDTAHELGVMPVNKLLLKFSIPCIISMLVNALYNIVDQIFIGQGVGYYGNAATSVAFPLVIISMALALMIGDGGGAFFSLKIGENEVKTTERIVGNVISMLFIFGIGLAAVSSIFLGDMLSMFGATPAVMPYAVDYTRIIALGLPFAMFSGGFNSVIRADGNPKFAMISMLSGAILNTILDPIFIFKLNLGVKGAAYATVLGQIVSTVIAFLYLKKFVHIKFHFKFLRLKADVCFKILGFGVSSLVTQLSIAIVAICTNNVLRKHGAVSIYGSEIPLAVFGIVTKVNQIMMSVFLGIAVGSQPILGFNFGAKKMDRVKETVKVSLIAAAIISFVGLLVFEFFPQQITNLFGAGDELYNEFAVMYFRIFLSCCVLNALQIVCTIFFQAIGKPSQAGILSMSRMIIFYLPALYLMPVFFGVKGVIFAGPIADILAFILTAFMMTVQMKKMRTE